MPWRRKQLGWLALLAAALPALAMAQAAAPDSTVVPSASGAGAAANAGAAVVPAAPAIPAAGAGDALNGIVPPFTIWDVKLGQPVTQIPDPDVVNVACGTNGGPASLALDNFSEFAKCPAEPSGLHEVHFEYDDEQAYVAKALELEYRFLQAGTSVYAHPVLVSVLVDDKGIARGIRIITDDRASVHDRSFAAFLETNLRARFGSWTLDCQKLPPADGEESVGAQFIHNVCTGKNPAGDESLYLEARYLRLKGQLPIDPETQKVQVGNFVGSTRFELVQAPYKPAPPIRR